MTAAGYSGRSAAQKLGVRAGSRVALINAPRNWTLQGMPEDVRVRTDLRGRHDVTVAFVRALHELTANAGRFARTTPDDGALWIAWPRKAGGHDSDVTENLLREVFLPRGLVDVKVAAIDHDWSGLKFVRRKHLRGS